MMRSWLNAILVITICGSCGFAQRFGSNTGLQNECQTPLNTGGQCVSLRICPEVLTLYRELQGNQAKVYSKELHRRCSNRVTGDGYPIVCCAKPSTSQISTSTSTSTSALPSISPSSSTEVNKISTTETPKRNEELCIGPDERSGICTALNDCPELYDYLRNNVSEEAAKFIRSSHTKCRSIGTAVCCPTGSEISSLPTEEDGCGISQQSLTKIVGGEDSTIGAWPWMALLGYDIRSAQPFKCGGSLITAKHVLSAAHCINEELTFVRVGEFDLATDTETKHFDINLKKVVRHPEYSPRDKRNDIAVLYLERKAHLSELIAPICLPTAKDLRSKSYTGYNPFVAGWGKTEHGSKSNVLQQLQIPVHEISVCRNVYTARNRFVKAEQFDETVMCAGDLSGGRDSCQGDSGGPLMQPEYYKGAHRYYLIGVVSYGINCGDVGTPGVYARVQNFLDWIIDRVAEV